MEIVACMPSLNPTSFITFIANITQLSEIRFNNLQLQFFLSSKQKGSEQPL